MTDFGTEAELSIHIPQRELRQARSEIESELGSVGVTVENGRAARPDGGVATSLAGGAAVDELSDQTDLLEDILDELGAGAGGAGGVGGGGAAGGGGSLLSDGLLAALGLSSVSGALPSASAAGLASGGTAGLVGALAGYPAVAALLNQGGMNLPMPGFESGSTATDVGGQMIDDILNVGLGPGLSGPSLADLGSGVTSFFDYDGEKNSYDEYTHGDPPETDPSVPDLPGTQTDVLDLSMPYDFTSGTGPQNPYADFSADGLMLPSVDGVESGNETPTNLFSNRTFGDTLNPFTFEGPDQDTTSGSGDGTTSPTVNVDATFNVTADSKQEIADSAVRQLRQEILRQLPTEVSNAQQRTFDSLFP